MKVVITGISPDNRSTIAHNRKIPKEDMERMQSSSDGNPSVIGWRGHTPVQLPYQCEATEYTTLEPAKFSLDEPDMPKAGEYQISYAHIPAGFDAPFHTTESVDNILVVSGELWLIMEDGTEVHLEPGDCVVQHGTSHGWQNRGKEDCWIAVTVLGVEQHNKGKQ